MYVIFVDFEKAFDRVPRSLIEWALRRKGVPEKLVAAITVMYNQVETVVQMERKVSDSFMVKVGVHQGSILSPLLFNIVLDEIAKVVNKEQLIELFYADDLLLIGRTLDEVKEKFSKWKEALEQKRLKVNLSNTTIMKTSREANTQEVSHIDPCSVCEFFGGCGIPKN